ncbi:MAG TPA: hypothetical protein DIC35_04530 [Candidatus Moranbacteria bacterium]|nr:hypothetical protein [Candidatus Moranbacteria bacterium]
MDEKNISVVEANAMDENSTPLMNNEKKFKKRKGYGVIFIVFVLIILFSLGGAILGFIAARGSSNNNLSMILDQKLEKYFPAKGNKKEVLKRQVIEEDSAVIDVVEKNSPAVVSIIISKEIADRRSFFDFPGFFGEDFFGNGGSESNQDGGQEGNKQKIGGGSGFIITSDGMIITNKHVVTDKDAEYTVVTNDGKEHAAKFLAADPVNDIAVIKIEGNDFLTLNLGDSDALKIGQTVIAIGNSLGEFSNTVSKGIVSGLRRSVVASGGLGNAEKLTNIIQTDAAINPGNSGGPLMNISGEVIGINVAMAQGAQSIGFAIPSNQIKKVINQVRTTGKISSPYIGVRYVDMDDSIRKQISFPYDYGVLVVRGEKISDFAVIPGSPADKAGITENDIILEINDTKIDKKNSLSSLIAKNNVGDVIRLKVWHKGDIKEISLKLEEKN